MDNQKIADRLIKLRGSRTQAEVAQAIGVTPSAYSMYENGERIPRDEIKKRIAEYYKRTVNTIFCGLSSQRASRKGEKNHYE